MGANQSTPSTNEQLAFQQLRALQIQNDKEAEACGEDYVVLNEKSTPFQAPWTSLNIKNVSSWEHELLTDPKNRLALSALSSADPRTVLSSRSTAIRDTHVFNVKIPFEGAPITNQNASGRCWLFASTNVFRVAIMKSYNLENFELSQAYLFFFDKLEKSNWFLEQILDTADQDLDTRVVQTLLSSPVSDGGQWDMVANLVEKYGLVPQVVYPDSYNAMNSGVINSIITTKLREDAVKLRKMVVKNKSKDEILATKEHMVREVHLILTLTLGPPPCPTEKFTWNYLDKKGKAFELTTTPFAFANELASPKSTRITNSSVHSMFSLVNDPRHKYNTLLTVDRLGNIVGGRGITYINVAMPVMKAACIAMLHAGLPIFFGCDVGKYSNREGIMDIDLIDYELGFNVKLGLSKKQRVMVGESAMTHAMVLTAVHLDPEGNPVRWRVQNSWGAERGVEGWFVMSDAWMGEFVYQAVVEPRFVDDAVSDVLKTKPTVLPLWDPMGALA
ncbi:putative cysteine proteinase 1, mitochondrial [Calycina marina]|uniref:Cysteine proteinase 1, mitochondrial n=1 Tax=Calycina marina TaxID=1763456 RepID=A0A9P7Z4W8_9HELO|nr:putative cysteine proteinase 1, mitochondrial [Calycina marina]